MHIHIHIRIYIDSSICYMLTRYVHVHEHLVSNTHCMHAHMYTASLRISHVNSYSVAGHHQPFSVLVAMWCTPHNRAYVHKDIA
jgi:hypothetical protein